MNQLRACHVPVFRSQIWPRKTYTEPTTYLYIYTYALRYFGVWSSNYIVLYCHGCSVFAECYSDFLAMRKAVVNWFANVSVSYGFANETVVAALSNFDRCENVSGAVTVVECQEMNENVAHHAHRFSRSITAHINITPLSIMD